MHPSEEQQLDIIERYIHLAELTTVLASSNACCGFAYNSNGIASLVRWRMGEMTLRAEATEAIGSSWTSVDSLFVI